MDEAPFKTANKSSTNLSSSFLLLTNNDLKLSNPEDQNFNQEPTSLKNESIENDLTKSPLINGVKDNVVQNELKMFKTNSDANFIENIAKIKYEEEKINLKTNEIDSHLITNEQSSNDLKSPKLQSDSCYDNKDKTQFNFNNRLKRKLNEELDTDFSVMDINSVESSASFINVDLKDEALNKNFSKISKMDKSDDIIIPVIDKNHENVPEKATDVLEPQNLEIIKSKSSMVIELSNNTCSNDGSYLINQIKKLTSQTVNVYLNKKSMSPTASRANSNQIKPPDSMTIDCEDEFFTLVINQKQSSNSDIFIESASPNVSFFTNFSKVNKT
jgi:hypothetical protein